MGVAARASTDAFYCEYQSVAPFIVCVGGFLSSCGLLLCTYFVWSATGRWFHKFIIVSIMTVFVILCMASAIAIFFSFVMSVDNVFSNLRSISADNCNLVLYYWGFAEIIIIILVIGFLVIGPFLMLACTIVYCLTSC